MHAVIDANTITWNRWVLQSNGITVVIINISCHVRVSYFKFEDFTTIKWSSLSLSPQNFQPLNGGIGQGLSTGACFQVLPGFRPSRDGHTEDSRLSLYALHHLLTGCWQERYPSQCATEVACSLNNTHNDNDYIVNGLNGEMRSVVVMCRRGAKMAEFIQNNNETEWKEMKGLCLHVMLTFDKRWNEQASGCWPCKFIYRWFVWTVFGCCCLPVLVEVVVEAKVTHTDNWFTTSIKTNKTCWLKCVKQLFSKIT